MLVDGRTNIHLLGMLIDWQKGWNHWYLLLSRGDWNRGWASEVHLRGLGISGLLVTRVGGFCSLSCGFNRQAKKFCQATRVSIGRETTSAVKTIASDQINICTGNYLNLYFLEHFFMNLVFRSYEESKWTSIWFDWMKRRKKQMDLLVLIGTECSDKYRNLFLL